ncbi:Gfo/Idh/MocA family protein [Enterocloster lavalensis]|uniref:Gfo/Idh/MocA family protein n=1 Tax=Enterocloster lavalensis TaxID=460384 RepID=UPI001D0679B2|nr:Gfo/Idh/MocA family oxidoreductase [Enterocloster lavalensis]MCB6342862.1 Gfo/Idh/MocA family oxidoreductase [Enterocloster lavalensis]
MKIAIIGCGFIAATHAQALTGMNLPITVAVDANLRAAQAFAEKWNIPEHTDLLDRVLEKDIDVVHVCTPPTLHYEMVRRIIQAGKHVICEKPLCLNPAQARDLARMANETGIVSAVNFNVRFHEACGRVKAAASSENFGRICLIKGSYEQEFHVLPADYMWRYQKELAGPMRATTEIGSHWIDLVRYLTGLEILEVSATYGMFTPDRFVKDGIMYEEEQPGSTKITVDSDDAVCATLKFSNGALGSLLLSEVTCGRNNYVSMEISGSKQSVSWNSEDPYRMCTASKFSGTTSSVNAFGGGFPETFASFFQEVYRDILSGKRSDRPSYPTFEDGYQNAAVCQAIYESANNHSIWTEVK